MVGRIFGSPPEICPVPHRPSMKLHPSLLLLTALAFPAVLPAGESALASKSVIPPAPAAAADDSIYDKIWSLATLYKNKENPWIQELSFTGREHIDWFSFDADQGQEDDWVIRRTRVGLKAKVLGDFVVHVETDLDLQDHDPIYNKLTDAYIQWSPNKAFKLTVGKQGAKFTLDGGTSSNALYTIDRSNIGNNFWFPEEYAPGITVSGESGNWVYNAGYFTSGEASPEFGDFNAGSFGLLSLGYNFGEAIGADKALLRADYVYQDPDPGNTFTRPSEQVASLNFSFEQGRIGLYTEAAATRGYGSQPDLFALQVLPTFYLNEAKTLQAVLRYTYINSDGDNGIRLARYENRVTSGTGDEYNEFYAGLNWFLYGHKLKFQTGVQYTKQEDRANDGGAYDGWGVTTGLRISW